MRNLGHLQRDAWTVATPYWRSEERWRARALIGAVIILNLALVGITVMLTFWQRAFFNALEAKDWSGFIALLLWWRGGPTDGFMPGFALLLATYVLFTAYALYLRQALQIRWRRWLTGMYTESWLANRAYYRIALTDAGTDNPDQRIAEDVRLFVDNTLVLGVGLVRSIVSLLAFVVVLWSLSEPLVLIGVTIRGYLVWVALLYAVLGTWLTHLIGRRLIALNYDQQKVEADFRFGLMRIRENAEAIAFYAGEANEKREFSQRFGAIVANWRAIMTVTKFLTFATSGYGQMALVFPFAVVAPAYFAGRMPLGGIFQTSSAFVQVQGALSWIVDNYTALAGWSATVDRLAGFGRSIAAARATHAGPVVTMNEADELSLGSLALALPDGRGLLRDTDVRIAPGERVMMTGASGAGKSTLLRAIAGIWPFGSGRIAYPRGRRLFMPQRPYIPLGTLKRAVCYPANEEEFYDREVAAAIQDAGLGHLSLRLSETDAWERRLSGGEQQRLALARILLLRPDWLFLDEATASLDPVAEEQFYKLLRERLPGATVISIAHRRAVADLHNRILHIEGGTLRPG
jgi:vitamin B12/bleomycin/antimicrobial peptide transport system ATP-binding/permease protein